MRKLVINIGDKFGKLTVTKLKKRPYLLVCLCACGNKKFLSSTSLVNGLTKSCGCLRKEITGNMFRTHGQSTTSTHKIWTGMLQRTNNKKNPAYLNYGGRGIKVCKWWSKFENFYKDMGKRPKDKFLDRIDNNKGYYKENCKWSTRLEQNNNTRVNIVLTYKGKTKTLSDWARFIGINRQTLYDRINKLNWSSDQALSIPYPQKAWIKKSFVQAAQFNR